MYSVYRQCKLCFCLYIFTTAIFTFYWYWKWGLLLKRTRCWRSVTSILPTLCLSSYHDLSVIDNFYHVRVCSVSFALWLPFLFSLRMDVPVPASMDGNLSGFNCSCESTTEGVGWGAQLAGMLVWTTSYLCFIKAIWRQGWAGSSFQRIYTQLKKHVCVWEAHLRSRICDC